MSLISQNNSVLEFLKAMPATIRYLLLGACINQFGFFIQAYLIVFMLARDFTSAAAGWGLAILSSGAVLGAIAAVRLSSKVGDRNAIIIATLATAVCVASVPTLVHPNVPVPVWAALLFACGLFSQMYRPPAATILSRELPPADQAMAFSTLRIALNLGGALGPLAATAAAAVDWALVFWLNAACSLLYASIAWLKLPADTKESGSQHDGSAPSGAAESDTSSERALSRDPVFWAFLGAMFLSSIVFVQFISTVPIALEDRGSSLTVYSGLLVVFAVTLIFCELPITAHVRHYPSWIPGTVGTTLLCLAVASFGLTLDFGWAVVLSAAILVSGVMISGPTMFAFPATFPLASRRARIAWTQVAFSGGCAVGPAAGAAAYAAYGDWVWAGCLLLALICCALCVVSMRPQSMNVHDSMLANERAA